MEDSLLNKIKEDLEKTGFGSELKSLKIFEKSDFLTMAGNNYFDKDEDKQREIDIVASLNMTTECSDIEYDYYLFNNLYITAEVKKSEKPWIVFKSNHAHNQLNDFYNTLKNFKFNHSNDSRLYRDIDEKLYEIRDKWKLNVNGIHEAFKSPNNPSRWYGASMTSIKSIIDIFENTYKDFTEDGDKFYNYYYEYQPLIILDGVLISAEMNENYEINLKEVDFARIDIKIETKAYKSKSYQVDIVTLNGLEDYLVMKKERQNLINDSIIKLENFDKNNCKVWFE
ncbi:MAG: hypothetical protein PHG81_03640 [Aliarcobacter sp.]|nr:hypothetical protein [Aliarcobacter sp.]